MVSSCWRATSTRADLDVGVRGRAEFGLEDAGELPVADVGVGREVGDGERCGDVAHDVVAHILDAPGRGDLLQRHAELALSAGPFQIHHELPGHPRRRRLAEVVGDEGEGEVEAGADARAGPHVALADEDRVGVDLDLRMLVGELPRGRPVGGGALAVEQPGGGQHVRPDADGRDPPGPCREPPHPLHHRGIGERPDPAPIVDLDRAGHDQGVDAPRGQRVEGGVGEHTDTGGGGDRVHGPGGEDHLVARRVLRLAPREGEHLRGPVTSSRSTPSKSTTTISRPTEFTVPPAEHRVMSVSCRLDDIADIT